MVEASGQRCYKVYGTQFLEHGGSLKDDIGLHEAVWFERSLMKVRNLESCSFQRILCRVLRPNHKECILDAVFSLYFERYHVP